MNFRVSVASTNKPINNKNDINGYMREAYKKDGSRVGIKYCNVFIEFPNNDGVINSGVYSITKTPLVRHYFLQNFDEQGEDYVDGDLHDVFGLNSIGKLEFTNIPVVENGKRVFLDEDKKHPKSDEIFNFFIYEEPEN